MIFGIYCAFYLIMILAAILEKVKAKKPAHILGTASLIGIGLLTIIYGVII